MFIPPSVQSIFVLSLATIGCQVSSLSHPDDSQGYRAAERIVTTPERIREDANELAIDAGAFDASMFSALDAAALDAEASIPDATADAGATMPVDAGIGSCTAEGMIGDCLPVSTCPDATHHPVPGHCPGPAEIQCCVPGPPRHCDPSIRPDPNAERIEQPGLGGCPAGMVRVTSAFCIDQYEAFLVERLPDSREVALSPFHPPPTSVSHTIVARSAPGAVPQGYIAGDEAAIACENAGKRLCSNVEWLRACRGSLGYRYPYGATREDGRCNDDRSPHPLVELFGTTASWIYSELDHACINQLPDSLAISGAHDGCRAESGAMDMMGNLHEWTSDPAGTFRGGFYVDTVINGEGCDYRTTAHSFTYSDYSTGFRCCWSDGA